MGPLPERLVSILDRIYDSKDKSALISYVYFGSDQDDEALAARIVGRYNAHIALLDALDLAVKIIDHADPDSFLNGNVVNGVDEGGTRHLQDMEELRGILRSAAERGK